MKNIKNLFDTILETLLFLIVAGGVLYFILCAGVYTAYGADAQLQSNIDALNGKQKTIAITILAEARGEGNAGMYAVACVIEQRARNRKLAPSKVCLQPWQFSCWNQDKRGKVKNAGEKLLHTRQAPYAIALATVVHRDWQKKSGLDLKWNKNADHYYSTRYLTKAPYCTKDEAATHKIRNHKFYKLKK